MAAPTFGITHTNFSYRFAGQSFSDWETQINVWIGYAASELSIILRQQGRDAGDVVSGGDLYSLCGRYIEQSVIADIARAQTRQNPEYAKVATEERDRAAELIRSHNESLEDDTFEPKTMMGAARAGGRGRAGGGARWRMGAKW